MDEDALDTAINLQSTLGNLHDLAALCRARHHAFVVHKKTNAELQSSIDALETQVNLFDTGQLSSEDLKIFQKAAREPRLANHIPQEVETVLQILGNILYLLKHEASYMSRLLAQLSQSDMDIVVEFIMKTLFANPEHEAHEHLLIKLVRDTMAGEFGACKDLKTFLRERSPASKMLSMIGKRGANASVIEGIVGTTQMEVLSEPETVSFELNPLKVLEALKRSDTNVASKDSDEVKAQIQNNMVKLCAYCDEFLEASFVADFGWDIKYLAKSILDLTKSRFPDDLVLHRALVGGFIFLRLINPAIIDTRDVGHTVSPVVMKNLIMVAKVLQNVSNGITVGSKEDSMCALNGYVASKHTRVLDFFKDLCQVESIASLMAKDQVVDAYFPEEDTVCAHLDDVIQIIDFLLEHIDIVAPHPQDPLRFLLGFMFQHHGLKSDFHFDGKLFEITLFDWTRDLLNDGAQDPSSISDSMIVVLKSFVSLRVGCGSGSIDERLANIIRLVKSDPKCSQGTISIVESLERTLALEDFNSSNMVEDILAQLESQHRVQPILSNRARRLEAALVDITAKTSTLTARINTIHSYIDASLNTPMQDRQSLSAPSPRLSKFLTGSYSLQETAFDRKLLIRNAKRSLEKEICKHVGDALEKSRDQADVLGVLMEEFPRNHEYYWSAINTISRLGKLELNYSIQLCLKGLNDGQGMGGSPWKVSKTSISYSMFRVLVKNDSPLQLDFVECVADFLAADMLKHLMQHVGCYKEELTMKTRMILAVFGEHFFKECQFPRGIPLAKWTTLRNHVKDEMAYSYGQYTSVSCSVDIMDPMHTILENSNMHYILRYVKLCVRSLPLFSIWALEQLNKHTYTTDVLIAMEMPLRYQEFELETFEELILPIYTKALTLSSPESKHYFSLLCLASTILCHSPKPFFNAQAKVLLMQYILPCAGTAIKTSPENIEILLHFLRAGGAVPEASDRLHHSHGEPTNCVRRRFGGGVHTFPSELTQVIWDFLLTDNATVFAKLLPVADILERIVLQLIISDFTMASEKVCSILKFNHNHPEYVLLTLRVLRVIYAPCQVFPEVLVRCGSVDSKPTEALNKFTASLTPYIKEIVVMCEHHVGIEAYGFANDFNRPSGIPLEDEIAQYLEFSTACSATATMSEQSRRKKFVHIGPRKLDNKSRELMFIEIYLNLLLLFPTLMPTDLMSPHSVSLKGLFVGRLLVHSDSRISNAAFVCLDRLKTDEQRVMVLKSLLKMVLHSDFCDTDYTRTVVFVMGKLLREWYNSMSVVLTRGSLLGDMKPWEAVCNSIEAMTLFFLAHPDPYLRMELMALIRFLQIMYNDLKRPPFGRSLGSMMDDEIDELLKQSLTTFQVIEVKQFSSRLGKKRKSMLTNQSSKRQFRLKSRTSSRSSTISSHRLTTETLVTSVFPKIDNIDKLVAEMDDLVPYCTTALVSVCANHPDQMVLLYELQAMVAPHLKNLPPSIPVQNGMDHDTEYQQRWIAIHATFFASCTELPGPQSPNMSKSDHFGFKNGSPFSMLFSYLPTFVKCLISDLEWLRHSAVKAALHISWRCITPMITTLISIFQSTEHKEKIRKRFLGHLMVIIANLLSREDILLAISDSKQAPLLVTTLLEFVQHVRTEIWENPRRRNKSKWADAQLQLAYMFGKLAGTLVDACATDARDLYFVEERGSYVFKLLTLQQRQETLQWLREFSVGASIEDDDDKHIVQSTSQLEALKVEIESACYMAVQNLLCLGPCYNDATVTNEVLLDEASLEWIFNSEVNGFHVLVGLLNFHTSALFPVLVDQIYRIQDESRKEVYLNAIAGVLASHADTKSLTHCHHKSSIWFLKTSCKLDMEFLSQAVGKLVVLTILQIASTELKTRLNGFHMGISIVDQLTNQGSSFVSKYTALLVAFESSTPALVRNGTNKFCLYLAEDLSEFAPKVFREAFYRLKRSGIEQQKEWLVRAITPWAPYMALYSATQADAADVENLNIGIHRSWDFLISLVEVTEVQNHRLQHLVMSLWADLASREGNLSVILDWVMGFKLTRNVATCKDILFELYSCPPYRSLILSRAVQNMMRHFIFSTNEESNCNTRNVYRTSQLLSLFLHDNEPSIADRIHLAILTEAPEEPEIHTRISDPDFHELEISTRESEALVASNVFVDFFAEQPELLMEFIPFVFVYSMCHFSGSNSTIMSELQLRILSVIGGVKQANSRGFDKLLFKERLVLRWENSDAPYLSSPDGMNTQMSATSYIRNFVTFLGNYEATLGPRIGREALRWALASSEHSLSLKLHTIYRTILTPFDHSCAIALLLNLLHVLKDWSRSSCYVFEGVNSYETHALLIVDTLIQVTRDLIEHRKNQDLCPALFWTGVALLKAAPNSAFSRGLTLLGTLEPWFIQKSMDNEDNSHSIGEFWSFGENWTPKFRGIQSCLAAGFMEKETETESLFLLVNLIVTGANQVLDYSPCRDLSAFIALLPWMYVSIEKNHQKRSKVSVDQVVQVLELLGTPEETVTLLESCSSRIKEGSCTAKDAELFLESTCKYLASRFLPEFLQECYDHLQYLIVCRKEYIPAVLKMSMHLCAETNPQLSLPVLSPFFSIAQSIVSTPNSDKASIAAAIDLLNMGIELQKTETITLISSSDYSPPWRHLEHSVNALRSIINVLREQN